MKNFKGWISENFEAAQRQMLAKRLDAQPARPRNSPIIDEFAALGTPEGLEKVEKRMMKEAKKKKQNPEYQIQADYVRHMADKYPGIMVFSDTAAHIGKTMFQQIRANKLQSEIAKDWPDVFVAQPSGDYAGLFLEFKAKTPYLKDGITLSSDKHIRAQAATMDRLRERGYFCAFVWEVSQAFNLTNKYLNL